MLSIRKLKLSIPLAVVIVAVNIGIVIAASANDHLSANGYVANNVNLRKPPLSAKSFTDRVYDGNKLGIVKIDSENWDKVKTINGLFGIVYSDLLNTDLNEKASRGKLEEERQVLIKKEEEEKNKFKEKDGWIDATDLFVRVTTVITSKSVEKLDRGNQVRLLNESRDSSGAAWYQIKTIKGNTGWIYSKYVSLAKIEANNSANTSGTGTTTNTSGTTNSSVSGESVAAYAKQYLGYNYTYGGASPSTGFDCSGFVNYVYKHFGISMARTSYDIAVQGQAITFANLRPGDVLAFQSSGSIGHVGLYIGNNQFIHAQSAETGVVISSIAPGTSYYSRFSSGRRFVN